MHNWGVQIIVARNMSHGPSKPLTPAYLQLETCSCMSDVKISYVPEEDLSIDRKQFQHIVEGTEWKMQHRILLKA